jgi:hypothetical protein
MLAHLGHDELPPLSLCLELTDFPP